MEKSLFEQMGGTIIRQYGDYLIPHLPYCQNNQVSRIGVMGGCDTQRYLKQHQPKLL